MSQPSHGAPSGADASTPATTRGEHFTTAAIHPQGADPNTPTLKKGLKNRHIQLIALGGAIGTGLFYGSSESISLAGPSILLAYVIGALAIFMIVRALGEMSVEDPKAGAFSYYASRYWSKRAGFISGWNYWFNYILVSMVELSVVGSFVNYWFPNIPQWVSAAVFLVLIAALNLIGVSEFGEFEFWFALIKIVAVIAMIIGGIYIIIANVPTASGVRASLANWFIIDGGFFPHGLIQHTADGKWTGLLMALVVVMFSFGGTELIGITAGETADPRRTIPKATNGVIWRILVFYVCALGIIMAVVPWDRIDGKMSPFVQIFDSVGVRVAAGILNFVCLTAVMSVYNSGLYSNSRMLYSLARQGNAPAFLGKLSKRGVPVAGVLTSAVITAIAVVVVFVWPEFAFNYLMSIATISALINWTMVMVTQMKFRKRVAAGDGPAALKGLTGDAAIAKIQFKLPGGRLTSYLVIAFLALVAVLMCFSPSYRIALIAGVIWLAVLFCAYAVMTRATARHAEPVPEED
ncbi:MAG: amino acid permease [Bifidobacterium sp.]|nr:amino acid permease [Bifidobacterium sp.]